MTTTNPARAKRAAARWTTAALVPFALTTALLAAGTGSPDPRTPQQARSVSVTTASPTTFKVATFNVLGASHTGPNGDKTGYASGQQRMYGAVDLIKRSGVQLVGFQELEGVQYDKFVSLMGAAWDTWPGRAIRDSTYTSVAWKRSDWTAIVRRTYATPYFEGRIRIRPLVQLRNNHTGQLVWFMNTHNPSNQTKWAGDEKVWRDESERIQAALANQLQRVNPDIPVIFTGDMNDSRDFYCPVTYLSDFESADGSTHNDLTGDAYSCTLKSPYLIDWIMGTSNVGWSGYTRWTESQTAKTSDHPYYFATASIAPQPARAAGVKRVVVVDLQGVRSGPVRGGHAPMLASLLTKGAGTLQARPDNDNVSALPNTVSMLSGRPVPTTKGGHGITSNGYRRTVHEAAGQYVSSVFDIAHNLGMRTALFSADPNAALARRTWDSSAAGRDSWGVDNGRYKIDAVLTGRSDADTLTAARTSIATRPARVTVVQFGGALAAGKRYGFGSAAYYGAVERADRRLARVINAVNANPATAGSTLVIATSTALGTSRFGWGLPLVAWGPSVERGGNLYAMNPRYTSPGWLRVPSNGWPINVGTIGNLVATSLTLPLVPRSRLNTRPDLDVFGP